MGVSHRRIYLDSCIIIYLVEEHPTFAPIIENHIAHMTDAELSFSSLSEMECLVTVKIIFFG